MTVFDVAVGAVLLVSGLIGLARGATREVTTVIALVLAVVAAIAGLRFAGPLARHFIATPWLATAAALLAVFLIVYITLRLLAGRLTQGVRRTALSGLDRGLGFAIGLVRGLVIVAVVQLLISATTPVERMPAWMTRAKLYPLTAAAAHGLRAFAPAGLQMAHAVAGDARDAVNEADAPPGAQAAPETQAGPGTRPSGTRPAPKRADRGYTDGQRQALDDLVEKSR